jgi:predicted enzyme related to lactoylglutathione lyase
MPMHTHVELHTKDTKAARAFYSGVFGWKYSEMPMPGGSYTMIASATGEPLGGLVPSADNSAPDSWIGYVTVASAKSAVAKAAKRGANIVVDVTAIPGMGSFAILTDPGGGLFGIWEDAPKENMVVKKASKKKAAKKEAAKKQVAKKDSKEKDSKKKDAKKTDAKKTDAKKKDAKKKDAKKTDAKKTDAKKKDSKKKDSKKKDAKKKSKS